MCRWRRSCPKGNPRELQRYYIFTVGRILAHLGSKRQLAMKCPHCTVAIHPEWEEGNITPPPSRDWEYLRSQHPTIVEIAWTWAATRCPACDNEIIDVRVVDVDYPFHPLAEFRAYPRIELRRLLGDEVPAELKKDYIEACSVLPVSAKASAALSRRVLQAILRNQGYDNGSLSAQIDQALVDDSPGKALTSAIRISIDAVRHLGNLAAHPTTDKESLDILDVEKAEAEWCLDTIEALFEHYYFSKSTEVKERLAALNAKLSRAGKPSVRS